MAHTYMHHYTLPQLHRFITFPRASTERKRGGKREDNCILWHPEVPVGWRYDVKQNNGWFLHFISLKIEQILWNMIFSLNVPSSHLLLLTNLWLLERLKKKKSVWKKNMALFDALSPSSWPNVLIHNLFKPWILSNFPRPLTGFDSLRSILPETAISLHYQLRYDAPTASHPSPSSCRG